MSNEKAQKCKLGLLKLSSSVIPFLVSNLSKIWGIKKLC